MNVNREFAPMVLLGSFTRAWIFLVVLLGVRWAVAQDLTIAGDSSPAETADEATDDLEAELFGTAAEVDSKAMKEYTKGQELMEEEKYKEAIERFTEALKLAAEQNRQLPGAYFYRGRCLAAMGRHDMAIAEYTYLLRFNSRFAEAYYERGRSFAALGEPSLALDSFGRAIAYGRNSPNLAIYHNERGLMYVQGTQYRDAIEDFVRAVELSPGNPEFLYNRGHALLQLGARGRMTGSATAIEDLQKAIASLDRSIAARGDDSKAYSDRALAKVELGQLEEGMEDLEKAVQFEPENLDYLQRLGLAHMQKANQETAGEVYDKAEALSDYQHAADYFTKVIRLMKEKKKKAELEAQLDVKPEDLDTPEPEADEAPAMDLDIDGQDADGQEDPNAEPEEAAETEDVFAIVQPPSEETESAVEKAPYDPYLARAMVGLSMAKHLPEDQRSVRYLAAIADCNEALQLEPKLPVALFYKGLAQRMLNDYQSAIDTFTHVLQLAPTYADAYLRRGIIWFHLGDYALALSDFEDANQGADDSRALFWAGLVHAQRSDYARAVMTYSEALRKNPNYLLAYGNRGLAYLYLKRYLQAINDFNVLIRRDRHNAALYYRRAIAQEGLEWYQEAIASYERAIELNSEFADAHRRLGELYDRLDRSDKAQVHLDKAKALEPIET